MREDETNWENVDTATLLFIRPHLENMATLTYGGDVFDSVNRIEAIRDKRAAKDALARLNAELDRRKENGA